ncbi:hypothetical protein vB_Efae230P-4.25 [Enterococcus phage vB_Efae230P-4]|uniref:Uncharacterized protein n=1 Tax=Enterococcus phage vB_Efae230P-4 TaxID=1161939 RepID=A0A067XGW0_9CAUD|nr:hypothetical protein vB_Efae230P-4.25 [Enterococcus phage vB_Efae230P-4]AFF27957.1 hypothetical protein vB_Efae230P-4.25 [Enterococcus phage vB_Efae230P-4]
MKYPTREEIFENARKGNRLTINPKSLKAYIHLDYNFKDEEIYVLEFSVKSVNGKKMKSTFVEFEFTKNGIKQAEELAKIILGL